MSASFFQNKSCEYFPCHEIKNIDEFNCLFCYCPLYALGSDCNGQYFFTKNGVKSCSKCTIVHKKEESALHIKNNISKVLEKAKKNV